MTMTEVEITTTQTVSGLLQALSTTNEAILHLGSLLVIKTGAFICVRHLTADERAVLDQHPELLNHPPPWFLDQLAKAVAVARVQPNDTTTGPHRKAMADTRAAIVAQSRDERDQP